MGKGGGPLEGVGDTLLLATPNPRASASTPHFSLCPPIRLLDRPDPAPGGMSLNVSGPRSQPCLH